MPESKSIKYLARRVSGFHVAVEALAWESSSLPGPTYPTATRPTQQVHIDVAESEFGFDGAKLGQESVSMGRNGQYVFGLCVAELQKQISGSLSCNEEVMCAMNHFVQPTRQSGKLCGRAIIGNTVVRGCLNSAGSNVLGPGTTPGGYLHRV